MAISEAMLAERPTATDVLDGRTVSYPMKLTAVYVSDVVILCIIKTLEKFSNVIGYHQPDVRRNRTVCASCLMIGQLKGQLICSCLWKWIERVMRARCCLAFRRVNCFFYENV